MQSVNPTIAWVCATVLLVVVLAGLFVLVWHGSVAAASVLPIISGLAAAAVGIFGVAHGVHVGAKAAQPPGK